MVFGKISLRSCCPKRSSQPIFHLEPSFCFANEYEFYFSQPFAEPATARLFLGFGRLFDLPAKRRDNKANLNAHLDINWFKVYDLAEGFVEWLW